MPVMPGTGTAMCHGPDIAALVIKARHSIYTPCVDLALELDLACPVVPDDLLQTAGTIGAVGNNNYGIAGINWAVQLLSCKFLTASGTGSTSNAITCIRWCRNQGAKITSNSW